MDLLFEQEVAVKDCDFDEYGSFRLSALLHYAQEAAGGHCEILGLDWDSMAAKGLFWAVLRHRVLVHRMPKAGERIRVQTWPMSATRAAYPRSVRALDAEGNRLFEVVSLWVLMNTQSRAMVLPGKSGVDVPGILRGDEPAAPGSLLPMQHENTIQWVVAEKDLDVNGHVNNAKYLDHTESLAGSFRQTHMPKEVTVCYLAEARLGQEIALNWTLTEAGILTVDGTRCKAEDPEKTERVFAVRLSY